MVAAVEAVVPAAEEEAAVATRLEEEEAVPGAEGTAAEVDSPRRASGGCTPVAGIGPADTRLASLDRKAAGTPATAEVLVHWGLGRHSKSRHPRWHRAPPIGRTSACITGGDRIDHPLDPAMLSGPEYRIGPATGSPRARACPISTSARRPVRRGDRGPAASPTTGPAWLGPEQTGGAFKSRCPIVFRTDPAPMEAASSARSRSDQAGPV